MEKEDNFVSCKEIYRIGDIVKYEYLTDEFSTAKILELNPNTAKIEIGLPYSKNSDIYKDILDDIPYAKLMPFGMYMAMCKEEKEYDDEE